MYKVFFGQLWGTTLKMQLFSQSLKHLAPSMEVALCVCFMPGPTHGAARRDVRRHNLMWCDTVCSFHLCDWLCASRAFWGFAEHFRPQAESLLVSLDMTKQKQLMGDQPSNSSSSTSLNSLGRGGSTSRGGKVPPRQMSATTRSAYRAVESSGIDLPSLFLRCWSQKFSCFVSAVTFANED